MNPSFMCAAGVNGIGAIQRAQEEGAFDGAMLDEIVVQKQYIADVSGPCTCPDQQCRLPCQGNAVG